MSDARPAPAAVPIEVRQVTLPGVGTKYVMPLRAGGALAIVVKPDGERQVFHFLDDDDRPHDGVAMERDEAQQLANLLGGAMVAGPDLEKLELALGALELEWVEVGARAPLADRTLAEVPLRSRTGASIIAILRGDQAIPNPGVDTVFRAGDTVLLLGSPEQCRAAREALLKGS